MFIGIGYIGYNRVRIEHCIRGNFDCND